MKNFKIGFVLLITAIFASCNTPEIEPTGTPGPTNTSQPTPTATQTLPPTKTPKPTPTPNPFYTENCVEVAEDLPEAGIPGVLVLSEGLLDLTTLQLKEFDHFVYGEVVSPDGNLIALGTKDNNRTNLLNSNGAIIKGFNTPGMNPIYWLDNTYLVLETIDPGDYFAAPSSILNTVTGSISNLETIAEKIDIFWNIGDYFWGPAEWTKTSISSNLSHVVFAQILNNKKGLALWNLNTNQEVMHFYATDPTNFPRWNISGEIFLVDEPVDFENTPTMSPGGSLPTEIFSISTDGTIKKLTHLSESFPTYQDTMIWSPDNSMVAFRYINFAEAKDGRLVYPVAILDMSTGIVENLCVRASSGIVWSPDGRYLLIRAVDYNKELIIIDLLEHKAYPFYDNVVNDILGWMN